MRKVTVSLPEETAQGVEALVQTGQAASFSAYVAAAAKASLERDWALTELRAHTGGPRGGELRARAARLFGDDPPAATQPTTATTGTTAAPIAAGDRTGADKRGRSSGKIPRKAS